MAPIASLTKIPEQQLDRFTRRIGVILLAGLVVFTAFYLFDRWRPPAPTIVDQNVARLEAAVRADPSDVSLRGQLADAYVIAERYTDAIASYDTILATEPTEDVAELAYFGRAKAYQATDQLDAAKQDFQAVVDIARKGEMAHVDPMLNAAFFGLGSIALAQELPADAIQYLSAAVAIKRSDADALNLLGQAYVANGEPARAIEPLRSAIAFVPIGWSEPYATLAAAYEATGDAARAEWALAMVDLSNEEPDAARQRLLALVDGPVALEATIGLGLIAEMAGDSPTAADWYRAALELDSTNAAARLGLSRVALPEASGALPALPTPGAGGGTN